MLYSWTDKLKFDENPQIKIKDTVLTVKADAETVQTLMDIVATKGETEATIEAVNLLFSPKDIKALNSLKLSMADYITVISTATSLAVGEDPDDQEE